MKKNKSNKPNKINNKDNSSEISVLYQNLNGELYAFTEVKGQIFWGKVSQSAAQEKIESESAFEHVVHSKSA